MYRFESLLTTEYIRGFLAIYPDSSIVDEPQRSPCIIYIRTN